MTSVREQERLKSLHEQALFDKIDPALAKLYMKQVLGGYDNPFDQARVARDLGKAEFRDGNPSWSSHLNLSLNLLNEALHSAPNLDRENSVRREQAATNGMYGRLALATALRANNTVVYSTILGRFKVAQQKLKEASGGSVLPDQYEINFAPAYAIAERYNPNSGRGFRTLGRAALIAPMSESGLARHHREGLSWRESFKAKRRSIGRTAFAARLAVQPDSYIEKDEVRHKAAAMMV